MKDRTSNSIGIQNWESTNWKVCTTQVSKLQRRIFRATQDAKQGSGSWNKVRSLMKLMLKSRHALLLAIRKVTQINKGRKTAGIDGVVVVDNNQRNQLIETWNPNEVAIPTRRVYIPKSNGKKRPLGIPAVKDRIGQAVMKLAYEPVFEVDFEPSSFGFRTGRSCHDAIGDLFQTLKCGSPYQWVFDADIKEAFDNISHEFILEQIDGFPKREKIGEWLKAGYMEGLTFHETQAGTPQGGLISPLLANIALDGLEEILSEEKGEIEYSTVLRGKRIIKSREVNKYKFTRYADDFVVSSPKKEWLEEIIPIIGNWLAQRGLVLNTEKSQIHNVREVGFSFLGFDIRQFPKNVLREGSNRYRRIARRMVHEQKPGAKRKCLVPQSKPKDEVVFACIIKPGKKEIAEFLKEIDIFLKGNANSMTFEQIINHLNPKIRGWGQYYRHVVSKETFQKIRNDVLDKLWRFLKRRHPSKSVTWIRKTYFTTVDQDFCNPYAMKTYGTNKGTKITLVNIAKDVPIIRFVKVKGNNSPFDPKLQDYWKKRKTTRGKTRFAKGSKYEVIYQNQNGICPICGEPIDFDEDFDLHHILPVKDGGTNEIGNLVFLHSECHKAKHLELHWK
ncbi:MAG: group II intron reverse transcriptase/maturase [Cyanobacteria bacterium J06635_10]